MADKSGVSLNWGGLDRALNRAGRNLSNRQALLDSVGEALVSGTLARFDTEKAPDGTPWEPSRRAQEEGGKTLTDTARLRNSIDYATAGDKVLVGSNLKYARIHQKGGIIRPKKAKRLLFKGCDGSMVSAKEVTIPARPYLGVSKDDRDEVKETIAEFMAGAFRGK